MLVKKTFTEFENWILILKYLNEEMLKICLRHTFI